MAHHQQSGCGQGPAIHVIIISQLRTAADEIRMARRRGCGLVGGMEQRSCVRGTWRLEVVGAVSVLYLDSVPLTAVVGGNAFLLQQPPRMRLVLTSTVALHCSRYLWRIDRTSPYYNTPSRYSRRRDRKKSFFTCRNEGISPARACRHAGTTDSSRC